MGFAGGLYLAGAIDLLHLGKPKEPFENKDASGTKKEKKPEMVQMKEFKKEDHDKYMPK